jgi:hypothetical protein
VALPSSRVPPVKTCPALRPRWCPSHSPYRTQDCCLPALANRRLTTTIPISGLNHAAYLLTTPGFVRPLAGRHAGSLLTCWLDVSQVGLAHGAHPLGNNNPFHGVTSTPKVSGLPWREHALVRGLGGYAATHVEGTGAAPGALCYPALETVGRRDRPRIGAVCPFVRLVSGVGDHITGDRLRPDPVWETASFSVTPAPTAVLYLFPALGGCNDTPQRLFP